TVDRYRKLAERLLTRAAVSLATPWQADLGALANHIAEWRPQLARATWRQYRAALVWHLADIGHDDAAAAIRALSETPCLRKTERTSARKSKVLKDEPFAKLINFLSEGRGEYDFALSVWLVAGSHVG